jgi:hypothetical protein
VFLAPALLPPGKVLTRNTTEFLEGQVRFQHKKRPEGRAAVEIGGLASARCMAMRNHDRQTLDTIGEVVPISAPL